MGKKSYADDLNEDPTTEKWRVLILERDLEVARHRLRQERFTFEERHAGSVGSEFWFDSDVNLQPLRSVLASLGPSPVRKKTPRAGD